MRLAAKGFSLLGIMMVMAILGVLIPITIPGALRAREISRRNSCQENLCKLDAAVQQYLLDNNLSSLDAATDLDGTEQAAPGDPDAWTSGSGQLIGEGSYIRYAPHCPSGGLYGIDAGRFPASPVYCVLSERSGVSEAFWHTYPSAS